MNTLSIDIGNGYSKIALNPFQVSTFPSHIAELADPSEACEDMGQNGSILTYHDGDRSDLVGRTFAVGTAAAISSPSGFQAIVSEGQNRGKVAWGLILTCNALKPTYQGETITVPEIIASLPDTGILGDQFRTAMTGRHVLTRNGDRMTLIIQRVTLKPESSGCLVSCLADGAIERGSTNAILDIGHGTVISTGFSPNGSLIPQLRSVSDAGIADLLASIANDPSLKKAIGGEAKIHLLQRAICGDFQYGSTGIDITEIYQKRLRLWAEKAIKPALQNLAPMADEIDNIILCGGGANILRKFAQSKGFIVANDPQNSHIKGLAIIAQKSAIKEVA
jgi:hypothetical protein